ncbi:MAG: peptidase domain-containing ABC transporter [Crocinitomicaceae bacterium]
MKKKFKFFKQLEQMDCGPTCLRMIAKHYGRDVSASKIRELSETDRSGSSIKNIADAAEKIGFRSLGAKISLEQLINDAPLPCIVHWGQVHFVVVHEIKKNVIHVADPAHGIIKYSTQEFLKKWIGVNADRTTAEGIVLLLEPTPKLSENVFKEDRDKKSGFSFLFQYFFQYKKFMLQLALGLLAGSVLQLVFPFLTQSIVDVGIQNRDIDFIYLILIAQLFLFFGRITIEVIRDWILLHLSTRINISLISDFFIKLMKLPIAYFDVKMTGDILQRINDHNRIERLLTTQSLNVLFSFFNLIVFGAVLAWYDITIFGIFAVGTALFVIWIVLFLKKRKELDYKQFSEASDEQSKVIELINGMQEIKLHNAEKEKRWSWEHLQARLFKISVKNLVLEQTQAIGSKVINELKNILITVFSAKLVIDGQITLGMMMAISYIIGQLNGPIQQLIGFVYSLQDAKIALERLSEIHEKEDEEPNDEEKISYVEPGGDIELKDVYFRYRGATENVLNGLNLTIPHRKTTAIVGSSGSGKTTLIKMLIKFYEANEGIINYGNVNLNNIAQNSWRSKCGVVMQEGYIFNDTIAKNIAIGQEYIDHKKLMQAVKIANIQEFVDALPLGFNTKVGLEGTGMSTGQKQRLLIARAVYKNPDIIFFDEATSALDAKNELIIMKNLNQFFEERTAIVIAHRLSTVRNADQIVVLDEGKIIEKGTHSELVALRGNYYTLVKNQLDLEKLEDAK